MRTPSRRMPPTPTPRLGLLTSVLLGTTLVGLLALPGLAWWPLSFVLPIFFVVINATGSRCDRKMAQARAGEDIGTFARSFDRGTMDPWIIRAVYEAFSGPFPIRASDRFDRDLHCDDEDWEVIALEIAQRVGRSMEQSENNPMYGKIHTVRDLVQFLHHQPLSGVR